MKFHQNIYQIRKDRDKTQLQVAKAIGCTRKQISRYENNEQEMTISKLRELCIYLNISADYLLDLPDGLEKPKRRADL